MTTAMSKRKQSTQKENLKKILSFSRKDRDDAIAVVKQIAQVAIQNSSNDKTISLMSDVDILGSLSDEQNSHPLTINCISEDSQSSHRSQDRAIFPGTNRVPFEENESKSLSIGHHSRNNDLATALSESPLGMFSGIRRRKKKAKSDSKFVNSSSVGSVQQPIEMGAWMCGVTTKRFASYEAACQHEDYHIREVVSDLGWLQTSLDLKKNYSAASTKSPPFQTGAEKDNPRCYSREQQQNYIARDQISKTDSPSIHSYKSALVAGPSSKTSRPDLLTVSNSTSVSRSEKFSRYPHPSSYKKDELNGGAMGPGDVREYEEFRVDNHNLVSNNDDDYLVLADEALADVCCKAQKLALTHLEQEAEYELECYSKDKTYYDILEKREVKRQRDGAYSRFRTEGKNFAQKVQNKFVDAYAIMKQGKSEKKTSSIDHYKRKIEGDPDVQNVMDNTKQTMYVNVIVKNSIQVVSHELDRLARQRWEERKEKEGGRDLRNEESRAQFEKFKAVAQGQLVQLAGLALASDFTPRRIAVQLSNDLYRLLTPRLKHRGVFIEAEIEYRVGPYFVLAVNVLSVDWRRLVKISYRDVLDRRSKWIKTAESDGTKEGVTRRHGPIASILRLSKMTSMEVLANILAVLYFTHWVIYTPICWFLYRFLIGDILRKYFLSSVTDEIFYYVEQKGMEMDIQIHDAETQAACMLSALQEIRADNRALKKRQEKAGSVESPVELLGPLLGPVVKSDAKPAPPIPNGFEVPTNLEFIGLELNLQVGFQRLRWALLNSESLFMRDAVWKVELNYDDIETNEWNKFNDEIGAIDLPDGVKQEDFIGAEKETSYLMPKSAFVAANMAHETAFIEAYNDYCFSLKLRTLTPDVPYGSTFEAWTKFVVVNSGNNSCKLTCSVEAVFPNGPPMISRQIKSGMRDGVGKVFVKTGEVLQRYANAYS